MNEQLTKGSIALENGVFETLLTKKFAQRKRYEKEDPGLIKALIPGQIAELRSKPGQRVQQGDVLLILEAMKMLNRIKAPKDGTVKSLHVAAGDKVAKGQTLLEMA